MRLSLKQNNNLSKTIIFMKKILPVILMVSAISFGIYLWMTPRSKEVYLDYGRTTQCIHGYAIEFETKWSKNMETTVYHFCGEEVTIEKMKYRVVLEMISEEVPKLAIIDGVEYKITPKNWTKIRRINL